MRFFLKIFVVAILFINFAQAAETKEGIVSHILDNGLQVLILEKHSMPVAAVQVWYNVGSVDEPNGLKGIAHLFEHMMFRGSKNFGPQEHFKLIQEAGGRCNAYTSDEKTVYHERLPADKLDLALRLEADRMANLILDQNVLDTERQVVLEEYRLRIENDPIGSIEKDVREFLFPSNPYQYGPIGKVDDIKKFTVEDCQGFYKKYYVPNNATLIIVGDVKAKKVIKMVEAKFGDIKPSQLPGRPKFVFASNQVKTLNKAKTDLPVPVTLLSFYTEGARDKDRAALEVLLNCLNNGKSSRLWKSLVNNKKVAEYYTGEYIEGVEKGIVILAAAHFQGLGGKVEKEIWRQLEEIKTKGPDANEFAKVQNQIRAGNTFKKYYAESLAGSIGFEQVIRGDYKHFYMLDEEIENVTRDDVIRVANRYFTRENMKKIYFEPRQPMFLVQLAGFIKSVF
jgi:zinc protease